MRRALLRGNRSAGGFDSDYQAILDEGTLQSYDIPSGAVQINQNQLVLDLKTAGVWDKIDEIYIMQDDIADGDVTKCYFNYMNWKSPSGKLTNTYPTRIQKLNGYVQANCFSRTFISPYLMDDPIRTWTVEEGTAGLWLENGGNYNTGSSLYNDNTSLRFRVRETSTPRVYWHRGTSFQSLAKSGGGALASTELRLYSRDNSGTPKLNYYEDGLLYASINANAPTQTMSSGELSYCNAGVEAVINLTPIKVLLAGQLLSATEHLDLYNALNTYFNTL